jgi:hypothetical protein
MKLKVTTTGPAGTRVVDARPVIRGLVIHDTVGRKGWKTFTHKDTGLSILDAPNSTPLLNAVTRTLMEVDWTISGGACVTSKKHASCVERALNVAKSHTAYAAMIEAEIAGDLEGGKVQPGSGAGLFHKLDVVTPKLAMEIKATRPESKNRDRYTIKDKVLEHVRSTAINMGERTPVWLVDFYQEDRIVLTPEECIVQVMEDPNTTILERHCNPSGSYTLRREAAEELHLGYLKENGTVDDCFTVMRIHMKTRPWIGMSYLLFLDLVKQELT